MKKPSYQQLAAILLIAFSLKARATVHYVNVANATPLAPYTSWATAATVIQDAIAATADGDQVLVTNGVYRLGGLAINGSVTNRVAITNAITVQSVNGPLVTVIEGQMPVDGPTTRCAYVMDGGVLIGFTLTNGLARPTSSEPGYDEIMGGGVYCTSTNTLVARCILTGNSANDSGGGAFNGTLDHCAFLGNSAVNRGGGASLCTLNNCTLEQNSALIAGGADSCTLRNCIVLNNTATVREANFSQSTLNYCCTTPLPADGTGNLATDPQLADSMHISATSPCRGAGSAAYASGTDLDGEAWLNPPSIGCDEFYAGIASPLAVTIQSTHTNAAAGFTLNFTGLVSGHASSNRWDFGDGTVISNQLFTTHRWAGAGDFPVVFTAFNDTFPGGVSATVTVHIVLQPVYYVARDNPSPAAPYTSWATAATNIQDAVDSIEVAGALVLVTNGIYDTGGHVAAGVSNRVAVTLPLVLQSVKGPATTVIQGDSVTAGLYLVKGTSFSGFTITNGNAPDSGGGLKCESGGVIISNCLFTGNSSGYSGGAAVNGSYFNCSFIANNAWQYAAGAYGATLTDCVLNGNNCYSGGGAAGLCILTRCTLLTNSAFFGGAVDSSILDHCQLSGNVGVGGGAANGCQMDTCTIVSNVSQWYGGGGVRESTLRHCTLTGNTGDAGGGAIDSRLTDCILTGNVAGDAGGGAHNCSLTNCQFSGNSTYNHGGGVSYSTVVDSTFSGNTAANNGGGAYFSTLTGCTLSGNYANFGGGDDSGTLNSCALWSNTAADSGGGVCGSTLTNCTLTGNSAANAGGGTKDSTLANCISFFNTARSDANNSGGLFNFCCTTPLPPSGTGNISTAPLLTDNAHLATTSSARGAGSASYSSGFDIDGESWLNPPSIGCDEATTNATGTLTVAAAVDYTNIVQGFAAHFTGTIIGHATISLWDFGDGSYAANQPYPSHAWAWGGDFPVVLHAYNTDNPGGISATVMVHVASQTVYYADAGGTNPVPPYASWQTAATNLQDAVDAGPVGAMILATNGIYRLGGRPFYQTLTNRLTVAKPQTVTSVNGPAVTAIQGRPVPGDVFGDSAVRCVYLGYNATLSGFTLTNGSTRVIYSDESDSSRQQSGAGVWCEYSAIVSNCVIAGNSAFAFGAGVYGGTVLDSFLYNNRAENYGGAANSTALAHCTISNNTAFSGGGIYYCPATNCVLIANTALYGEGGGAEGGSLDHCVLAGNSAPYGGGVWAGNLYSCSLSNNSAGYGGGAAGSTLNDCMVAANSAGVGGGAYQGTLNNCSVIGNHAHSDSGGASSAYMNNCAVSGNTSGIVGGAGSYSVWINCTIVGNSAAQAGGVFNGVLASCIIYYNYAKTGSANWVDSSINYCCTTPLPDFGMNNIAAEPLLADFAHLSALSPCRAAGDPASVTGTDIDGEAWAALPSMGCDEFYTNNLSGALVVGIQADFSTVTTGLGLDLTGVITGHASSCRWDFGDGTATTNRPYVTHAWSAPGDYLVTFTAVNGSNPAGVSATTLIHVITQPVHYVNVANVAPVAPYVSWATAATNIQDAIDAASVPGTLVLVTNGTYATGQRVVFDFSGNPLTNRVTLKRFTSVQSVNGPTVTVIDGGGLMRCAYLTNNAVLNGFTLTNGHSLTVGGGIWCEEGVTLVTNCLLAGNWADDSGGGAYAGVFSHCTFTGNSATNQGGGVFHSTLNSCTLAANSATSGGAAAGNSVLHYSTFAGNNAVNGGAIYGSYGDHCLLTGNMAATGGGAYLATLTDSALTTNTASGNGGGASSCTFSNCMLTGNVAQSFGGGVDSCNLDHCAVTTGSAWYAGGGIYLSTANNCLITSNSAGAYAGGGAYYCTLNDCTVAGNSAPQGSGVKNSTANNCIVYYNPGADFDFTSTLNYSCAPGATGFGDITNEPLFMDLAAGDFRLQPNSPCINAGKNAFVQPGTDFAGNPRIQAGTVDIGAYEFQTATSTLSYAWAQQFGFATDGSADYADPDGDGFNNRREWLAGTIPTNSASVLKLFVPNNTTNGWSITWLSVSNQLYFLERSTNLTVSPAFTILQDNIPAQGDKTTYMDTSASEGTSYFYRVGVH